MAKQSLAILLLVVFTWVGCKNNSTSKKSKQDFSKVTVDTDSESEKFSYSIGMIIGNTLKNNGIDSLNYSVLDRAFEDGENDRIVYSITSDQVQNLVNEEVDLEAVNKNIIKRAIYDVLDTDTTLITLPEVSQAYQGYMQNNQSRISQRNLDEGKKFLENNLTKDGVKVTDSGLQYRLIQEGTGEMPSGDNVYEVFFTAKTVDGKEIIDNTVEPSYVDLGDKTSEFAGLVEGIQLFPLGSEFDLFVPSNLAFGNTRISPEAGPNSTLVIHVTDAKQLDDATKKQYRDAKAAYFQQLSQQQQQYQQMGGR